MAFLQKLSAGRLMALLWGGVLAFVLLFLPHLKISNQLTAFFPQPSDATSQLFLSVLTHSLSQQVTLNQQQPLMVSLAVKDSVSINKLAMLSHKLKQHLLSLKKIQQVSNTNQDFSVAKDNRLFAYRYLLMGLSTTEITQGIKQFWQGLQMGGILDKRPFLKDPSQSWLHYLQRHSLRQIPTEQGIWMASEKSGKHQALLLLEVNDTAVFLDLKNSIQHWVKQQSLGFGVKVSLSNARYISVKAKAQIQHKMVWVSVLASAMVLGFLAWVFKSFAWTLAGFLPLVVSTLFGTMAVQFYFGSVEAITLALGMVLIGITVDYAIHGLVPLRQDSTMSHASWKLILLGGLTTVFGFLSLLFVDVYGIHQLAVFATIGILSALMTTRWLISILPPPSLVIVEKKTPKLIISMPKLTRPGYFLGFFSLVLVGYLMTHPLKWQDDLASLSPVPKSLLQQDGQLRQAFNQSEAGQFLVLKSKTMQGLLVAEEALKPALEQLKQQGTIQGDLSLSTWLPSKNKQQQNRLNLPTEAAVTQAINAAKTPLLPRYFTKFFNNLTKSKQMPLLDYDSFEANALNWQQKILPLLVMKTHKEVVGKVLLTGVAPHFDWTDWANKNDIYYFNQRHFVAEQVNDLRIQILQVFAVVLLSFVIFLTWQLRSWRLALWVIFPVLVGLLGLLVLLDLMGVNLSVFHVLAGLLTLSIGLDYSLFAVSARQSQVHFNSVNFALMTTLLSFGFLLLTGVSILIAIGQTIVFGIFLTYLAARFLNRV